jgi:hypothetical protein
MPSLSPKSGPPKPLRWVVVTLPLWVRRVVNGVVYVLTVPLTITGVLSFFGYDLRISAFASVLDWPIFRDIVSPFARLPLTVSIPLWIFVAVTMIAMLLRFAPTVLRRLRSASLSSLIVQFLLGILTIPYFLAVAALVLQAYAFLFSFGNMEHFFGRVILVGLILAWAHSCILLFLVLSMPVMTLKLRAFPRFLMSGDNY